MAQKSILIIGAGVAGLCAGIYGQMNGYQTRIVEQHKIPGGLVTAYRRKGYLIDLCIHWLAGSGPGLLLHRYWNEVGLLEGREFLQHDRYGVYHAKDGRTVNFYCDPDRLEKHLLELAPEDAQVIHELAEGVRLGIRFKPPAMEQYEAGTLDWIKFILGMHADRCGDAEVEQAHGGGAGGTLPQPAPARSPAHPVRARFLRLLHGPIADGVPVPQGGGLPAGRVAAAGAGPGETL